LSPYDFCIFLIDNLTVSTGIAVWNTSHVDVTINISPNKIAQKSSKSTENYIATWCEYITLSLRITS